MVAFSKLSRGHFGIINYATAVVVSVHSRWWLIATYTGHAIGVNSHWWLLAVTDHAIVGNSHWWLLIATD